jgi:hypothetical protein
MAQKRAKAAYDQLFSFFEQCQFFHGGELRQELQDHSFWEFVILNHDSDTKRSDREREMVPLSAYEEELQTIFFILKSLDAVISDLDDQDKDKADNNDMVEDEVDDIAEELIETEEECIAALHKLSQVKKDKILQTDSEYFCS